MSIGLKDLLLRLNLHLLRSKDCNKSRT